MIASYERLISYYDKLAKDPTKTFESDSYALWLSGIFDSINFSDLRDVVGEDKLFEVLNFYKEVKHCYEFRPTKIVKEAAQEKYQILNSPSLDQLMQNANFSHIDSGAQKQALGCINDIKTHILPKGPGLIEMLKKQQKPPSIWDKIRSFFGFRSPTVPLP